MELAQTDEIRVQRYLIQRFFRGKFRHAKLVLEN